MTQVVWVIVTTSALVSVMLTGLVRAYAVRHGVLDRPNARSSHRDPTPRGGGLAVIVASSVGMTIAAGLGFATRTDALTLATGMLVTGTVGWLDDIRSVRPATRLTVHIAVALWTVAMLHGLPAMRVGNASLALGTAGYIVGVLGIVWSINLFNFMDGIDGLAGSQAVLIFSTGALLLFARGDQSLGTISAIAAATTAGFLVWNWPPARIFLGDVGSGAIGYLVGAIAIGSENHGSVPLLAFAIVYGLFIADATITLVRRIARGERPADAHRDHAYQRLARVWNSHRSVTSIAAAVTFLLAIIAAAGTLMPSLLMPALSGACVIIAVLLFATERRAPM